jgi:hypothetical protein
MTPNEIFSNYWFENRIHIDTIKHKTTVPININSLFKNKNLTWNIIKNNQDWDLSIITCNPCITWKIIKENPYPNGKHSS